MNQIVVPGPKYDLSLLDFSSDINKVPPSSVRPHQTPKPNPPKKLTPLSLDKGSIPVVSREASDQAYLALVSQPNWFGLGRGFYGVGVNGRVVTVEFRPTSEGWRLLFIGTSEDSRGEGLASKALKQITDAADKAGVVMQLTVDPQGKGGLSKAKLFKWYERNGFKRQPYYGQRNKLSDDMIRHPVK